MSEEMICPICGKKTRVFRGNARKDRLCGSHADQLKANLIELNEDGFFVDCKTKKVLNQNFQIEKNENNTKSNVLKIACLICGKDSHGLHFCKDCYYKYKDRSIDIRITHCNETEILDEYGNLQYKCDDGRKVRSRAEVIISNFLFKEKVRAVYEETVYYTSDNNESKTLHPDFYLPDYALYIEYNELTNKPYLKSKEYVQKIYNSLNKKVMIINDNDLKDIAACLKPMLGLH